MAQGSYNSEMFLVKSGKVEVSAVDKNGQTCRIKVLIMMRRLLAPVQLMLLMHIMLTPPRTPLTQPCA